MYHEYHYVPIHVSTTHVVDHYYPQAMTDVMPKCQVSTLDEQNLNRLNPQIKNQEEHHHHHEPNQNFGGYPYEKKDEFGFFGQSLAPFLIGGLTGAVIANHHNEPPVGYPPAYAPYPPQPYPYVPQAYPGYPPGVYPQAAYPPQMPPQG